MRSLKLLKELMQNKRKSFLVDYYFQRGVSHYAKGAYDKAVADFLRAMDAGARDDGIVAACIYCAISYYRNRDYDKAVKFLHKYLEHEPDGKHAVDVRRLVLDLEIE